MFDISSLKNGTESVLKIDEKYEFSPEKLKGTDIKRLEDVHVVGEVSRLNDSVYHLSLKITGNMVLLCARSLEEVNYPIDIAIDKTLDEEAKVDEIQVFFQNSLDIFEIVWENIVLEVPLRVIKEDAPYLHEGDGWSLLEEEIKDSPFSELSKMLDMEEER